MVHLRDRWRQGRRKGGGKVRTILRAHDGRGPPRGRNVISTEGTLEPCISARPRPGFDRANFHVIIQTFRLLLMLYFRHPSISEEKKLPRWWKQHETVLPRLSRAARQCLESRSSREPSAQLKSSAFKYSNKACHKPQQK